MAEQVCRHDDTIADEIDQVIHVPVVQEVVFGCFACLELSVLAARLIDNEDKAVAKEREVDQIESLALLNVLLQSVCQERYHSHHVEDEGHELGVSDFLEVDVPVAAQQTADKLGRDDLLILCVVQDLDQV